MAITLPIRYDGVGIISGVSGESVHDFTDEGIDGDYLADQI